MVGFESREDAQAFLEYLHDLPEEPSRWLHAASKRDKDGRVRIRKFKIRVAFLKEE
jgi:hypothetical protein